MCYGNRACSGQVYDFIIALYFDRAQKYAKIGYYWVRVGNNVKNLKQISKSCIEPSNGNF